MEKRADEEGNLSLTSGEVKSLRRGRGGTRQAGGMEVGVSPANLKKMQLPYDCRHEDVPYWEDSPEKKHKKRIGHICE